ncbi:MAG: FG-GAP repeat protein [Phycisphaerales bacterium]
MDRALSNRSSRTGLVLSALGLAMAAGSAQAQCDSRWVHANDAASADAFGQSVALSTQWMAVGAPNQDNAKGGNAGCAYIYARVGPAFIQVFQAIPSTAGAGTQAGWSVDVTDKYLLVGHRDSNGLEGGATVFRQSSGIWTQQATLTPGGLDPSDRFGEAVAIDGVTALVGAPGDDTTGPNSGAVYFFTDINGVWTPGGAMTLFNNDTAEIGSAVDISGSVAVVGAPRRDSSGQIDSGAVFIVRQGLGWNLSQTLVDPELVHSSEHFGAAVAIDGDTIVVGAPMADTASQQNVGTVYIYNRVNNLYEYVQRIPCPDFDYANDFGTSVAISGDVLAIGATASNGPKTYYMRRGADGQFKFEGVYAGTFGYATDVAALGSTIVTGDNTKSLTGFPTNSGAVQAIVVPASNGANQWWNAPTLDLPGSYTGCTSGATSNGSASCGSSANSPDVWYIFTAPTSGTVSVDTIGSSYDTVVSIHEPGFPGTSLVCNDDMAVGIRDSRVTMGVVQGTQYLVRVSGFNNASGEFNLNIRMQCKADLTTGAVSGQAGYGIPNGTLNNDDFFYFLSQFAAGNLSVADMTTGAVPGMPGYGTPNGVVTNDDFFYYLSQFSAGC